MITMKKYEKPSVWVVRVNTSCILTGSVNKLGVTQDRSMIRLAPDCMEESNAYDDAAAKGCDPSVDWDE